MIEFVSYGMKPRLQYTYIVIVATSDYFPVVGSVHEGENRENGKNSTLRFFMRS